MRRRNPATAISTTQSCPHRSSGRPIRLASRSAGRRTLSVHAISAVVPPPSRSSRSRASATKPPPAVGDEENLQASQALRCKGGTQWLPPIA